MTAREPESHSPSPSANGPSESCVGAGSRPADTGPAETGATETDAADFGPAQTGAARAREVARRRRSLSEIFGDVLPETNSDEQQAAPEDRTERWYRENRPPHHGDTI